MSNFKKQLEKQFREKHYAELDDNKKNEIKLNTVNVILKEINDKNNRYIFYCPDIALVNPLVKLVYETAFEVKKAGYNVIILHELNGFKAHWLYDHSDYEEYRTLPVEYIINKVSKKSKREKNMYSFRASDTLIVTDAYQDMLDNILSEESLKLVQKIVLVTGYMGLSSIQPGMDYNRLNVNSLIFFDESIKADYDKLFNTKAYLVNNYPISNGFKKNTVDPSEVYPVIGITSIGNNDKAQQLINVFYNRYPNLSMFVFKVISRDNMETFIDNLATSAAIVVLDKNIVTKQMIYEYLSIGGTPIIPKRREFFDDPILMKNFVVEDDVFEMAATIANYCQYWLNTPTSEIKNTMLKLADELELDKLTVEDFGNTVRTVFNELHDNRHKTFSGLKEMLENEQK